MASNALATRQTAFSSTRAIRKEEMVQVSPTIESGDDDIPLIERPKMGFWQRIKPKTYEEKWAGAMGAILALCMTGLLLLFFNGSAIRAQTPSPTSTQRPIMPTPTIQQLELTVTPAPLQSAVETQTVAMVINSAPIKEAPKKLPEWATNECVLRIAGTAQGEGGGLGTEAIYAIAQQLAWDANQCQYKTDFSGCSSGTCNEAHIYTFEGTKWSGRTSKNDNRLLDKGMVLSVLESEVRPEILETVTQALMDFDSGSAVYPNCEFVDNTAGMLLRMKQGARIDYIFTGPAHRVTDTDAEYLMNCTEGK